nr:MAG TPA: hypothetical protein [Caudoviricetes sp.]
MHRGFFIPPPPRITPILCSIACFYVNYSHRVNFSRKIFGGSGFSLYFCQRKQDSSNLLSDGDCIRLGFTPWAFFMPVKYHFPGSGKKVFTIWRLHDP